MVQFLSTCLPEKEVKCQNSRVDAYRNINPGVFLNPRSVPNKMDSKLIVQTKTT